MLKPTRIGLVSVSLCRVTQSVLLLQLHSGKVIHTTLLRLGVLTDQQCEDWGYLLRKLLTNC